jgi:hypothetical protein
MTDAGRVFTQGNSSGSGNRAQLLRQIAVALDMPVSAFAEDLPAGDDGPSPEECAALMAAFSRIRDPRLRAFCRELMEGCADG